MSQPINPNDPYRYGAPPPPVVAPASQPTGREIVRASWALLKQDRELIWLPIISSVVGLVAAVVFFIPGFALGSAAGNNQIGGYVGGILALFAASVVGIYFQAALVIGANQRADGGDPTMKGVLAAAWQLKTVIVAWAVLATTVGVIIRAIEQRFGAIGRIIGFLGGIAWAIATFLVVPVLVAERLTPINAVKRSAQLLRQTWGTSLRSTLRLGVGAFLLYLPAIALIIAGAVVIANGNLIAGVLLVVVGFVALLVVASIYSAMTTYARAMIYRYTVGQPVPGMSAELLAGAFAPKRGRR